jgi:Barstar (barnase inhibitor)
MAWNIAVVADPNYHEDAIDQLVRYHPIWIVDTPSNQASARVARKAAGDIWVPEAACTTYSVKDIEDRENNCLNILDMIELHHPSMSRVNFIGIRSTPSLISAMKQFAFVPTHASRVDSVAFARPVTALSNAPTVHLDASSWHKANDVYTSIFEALGSPSWHGRNFSALNDSIVTGGINAVEVPYTLSINGLKTTPIDVQAFVSELVDFISEREADGCPVSTQIEN